MADETVRMGRLIQDLRDLSLAEIDELTLHKEPADINTMLERAVSMLQPLCEEKSLTVRQNLSRDLPSLVIDVDRINQVIYNLLNNAIRYIDKGCTITVSTMKVAVEGKTYAQVQVADTGKGIAPEDLNHIYQYFYRSEQSRNRKSGGSGIGLALAQQFIRSHGGNIWADSTVGKGTTFTFILPLKAKI